MSLLKHGTVTTPKGWRASVAACGIKYVGRNDLALLVSDAPCSVGALFTTNKVQSAHISYDKTVLCRNTTSIRAVLINTGSANACTGEDGIHAAKTTAETVEQILNFPRWSVLVMSTGVIGVPLPMDKMKQGIVEVVQHLDPKHGTAAAQAIMTTDTRHKQCAVQVPMPDGSFVHIGGMAKGAGMIHPNMATMLALITTDAVITPDQLDTMLRYVADRSFHCISVDGDTSTNDTLLMLANGQATYTTPIEMTTPAGESFLNGLLAVCQYLAKEIVRDGEGATRFITINVHGAVNEEEARHAAMTVARSPLVKTALFGADPNWGRVICALGNSGVSFHPDDINLSFGPLKVFADGMPLAFDEHAAHKLLNAPEIVIDADLCAGHACATVWTCDFSYDYVKINAEYRT